MWYSWAWVCESAYSRKYVGWHWGALYVLVPSFGIELNEPLDASATYGTEGCGLVRLHATVGCGAIYAFRLIACTLIDADSFGVKRRNFLLGSLLFPSSLLCVLFRQHIFPLGTEILHRSDVVLPRLNVGIIILHVLVVVVIFIGQTSKAVAKLMHHDRAEGCMACRCQGVTVIDAATAIVVRIGQYNNVLVGDTCQQIVQLSEV